MTKIEGGNDNSVSGVQRNSMLFLQIWLRCYFCDSNVLLWTL